MTAFSWLTPRADGCVLTIKVVPRAAQTAIAAFDAPWLRVRLRAPPVEGRANAALLEFLAEKLAVPASALTLAAGAQGRVKQVRVAGLSAAAARAKLET